MVKGCMVKNTQCTAMGRSNENERRYGYWVETFNAIRDAQMEKVHIA